MATNEDLERVREFFKGDRYAMETGAVIDEIDDHYAKCSLVLTDLHKNAMGGVMGGVYFTLADFAFAVASNWQSPGVVGLNMSASYIGVPKSGKLIAEATMVKESRHIATYQVEIRDDLGNITTIVQCIGFNKRKN